MKMKPFQRLEEMVVWQESMELAQDVYALIKKSNGFIHDFGLRDQTQRSAVSIPSNIAEGYERETKTEFIRFLYIAKGSCGELRTQLLLAHKFAYLSPHDFERVSEKCRLISSMIANLIKSIRIQKFKT